MFYFNTNKPQSNFFCRIPVVLESRRSFRGGGGGADPLHPPPRSAPACNTSYRTGLHDNFDCGFRNSQFNVSTGHVHSIFKRNETVFENLSISTTNVIGG